MKRQRERITYKDDLPSMTQQHFKEEADVNSILEKYRKTGMVTHINQRQPKYGDFSNMQDLRQNLDLVMSANDQFLSLPSRVRREFNNDPAELVEFLADPSNHEKAIELGLLSGAEQTASKNDDLTTIKGAEPAQATTPETPAKK